MVWLQSIRRQRQNPSTRPGLHPVIMRYLTYFSSLPLPRPHPAPHSPPLLRTHLITRAMKQQMATPAPTLPMAGATTSRVSCSGVCSSPAPRSSCSVLPHSLCSPTATTSARALPSDTWGRGEWGRRCQWGGRQAARRLTLGSCPRALLRGGGGQREKSMDGQGGCHHGHRDYSPA